MDFAIDELSTVPAGTILAWIVMIGTIISGLVTAIVWLYNKVFKRLMRYETKRDEYEELLKQATENINDLREKYIELASFVKTMDEESKKIDKIKLRHSIVRSCEEAINNGYITFDALRSIDELYEVYSSDILNGNSYAEDLVNIVHTLSVSKREGQ